MRDLPAMLDLRSEARRTPVTLDAALRMDDESRQAAIGEWTRRMVEEQASSRAFAGLLPQMMRAGVDPQFQAAAADAVVDELRHSRLCAAVVQALGGEARAPMIDADEMPRHDGVGTLEALLRNILEVSCLEETVGVAVLEHRYRHARESTFRRVIAEILDDEIGHSRLGWRLLQQLEPRIDARLRERLGAHLVPAFARLLERHGAPHESAADKVLLAEAINEVIVPRLEAFELPARPALAAALATPDAADDPFIWAATD
jgi:hypothetical protein